MYEVLQNSPDEQAFQAAAKDLALSNAIDLTWMASDPLELRAVQELLNSLASAVLTGTPLKYSPYDEPRYRASLQLQLGNTPARAAAGGVLTQWAGRAAPRISGYFSSPGPRFTREPP